MNNSKKITEFERHNDVYEGCLEKIKSLGLEVGSEFIYIRSHYSLGKMIYVCKLTQLPSGGDGYGWHGSPFIQYKITASTAKTQIHYMTRTTFWSAKILVPGQLGYEEAKKRAVESGIRCIPPRGERLAPFKEKGLNVRSKVKTPDGIGVITKIEPNEQKIQVSFSGRSKNEWYGVEQCTLEEN